MCSCAVPVQNAEIYGRKISYASNFAFARRTHSRQWWTVGKAQMYQLKKYHLKYVSISVTNNYE